MQKLITRYGYASRRNAEELIKEGRVRVNGARVNTLGTKVSDDAVIEIDGKPINKKVSRIYLKMYKPAGYLCSRKDPLGRRVVYNLLEKESREAGVFTVGRLDYWSEGLLLLTNDGELAHRISHPSGEIVKEYEVVTGDPIPYKFVDAWKKGVYIKGTWYTIKDYRKLSDNRIIISLNEGKNREIRRLFSSIRIKIEKLKRIAIGSLLLGDLEQGRYRELSAGELAELLPDHPIRSR